MFVLSNNSIFDFTVPWRKSQCSYHILLSRLRHCSASRAFRSTTERHSSAPYRCWQIWSCWKWKIFEILVRQILKPLKIDYDLDKPWQPRQLPPPSNQRKVILGNMLVQTIWSRFVVLKGFQEFVHEYSETSLICGAVKSCWYSPQQKEESFLQGVVNKSDLYAKDGNYALLVGEILKQPVNWMDLLWAKEILLFFDYEVLSSEILSRTFHWSSSSKEAIWGLLVHWNLSKVSNWELSNTKRRTIMKLSNNRSSLELRP